MLYLLFKAAVSSEDLIKFAFRISSSNAVEAPPDWQPGKWYFSLQILCLAITLKDQCCILDVQYISLLFSHKPNWQESKVPVIKTLLYSIKVLCHSTVCFVDSKYTCMDSVQLGTDWLVGRSRQTPAGPLAFGPLQIWCTVVFYV